MKRFLTLSVLMLCITFAKAQQNKIPVFSKVTATWCTNCGTWGWDFMEEMKDMYNNGDEAVLLGVHYSGDLQNPLGSWFSNNLRSQGQPVFFINNQDLNATRNNWSSMIPTIQESIETINDEEPTQRFSFDRAYINENNEIIAKVNFEPYPGVTSAYYFGVYIFENNVQNRQTSQPGIASHPNVLRDVMSDNFYGNLVYDSSDFPTGNFYSQDFKKTLDPNWDANNVGLVAILWRKDGDFYTMDNSAVIYNIGLLSSTSSLIDESIVDIKTVAESIIIDVDSEETYAVSLINPLGQVITKETFNRRTTLNTANLVSGIYTVHLTSGNNILSKQVFVSK